MWVGFLAPLVVVAVAIVASLLGVDFGPLNGSIGRYSPLVLEFAGAAACLSRAWRVREERTAWMLIGIAVLLWTIGDVYFRGVLFESESVPVPSPSDVFWIAFYPFAYAGIGLLIRQRARNMRSAVWIDGLIAALAVATVAAAVVFGAVLAGIGGAPLATATNLAYPLADMLLMALIIVGFSMTGWRDRTWIWLGASLSVFAVTDSVYLFRVANGTYSAGEVLDAGWTLGLMLVGVAAWQTGGRVRTVARPESWRSILLPICFALVVIGIETYDHFHPITILALVLAGACLVTVVLRLAITFAQNVGMLHVSREEASTDPLTGLANRRLLTAHLADIFAAPDNDARLLVIFDLNGFKLYNDTFGHPAGDALLVRLGRRLEGAVAGHGHAYRMGGDEFCVLMSLNEDAPEPIASRVAIALSEQGDGFSIDASYGWGSLPVEAKDADSALRLVDQRMYVQKQGGRASARAQSKDVLLQALVERSPSLAEHLNDVSRTAVATARRLGLGDNEQELIATTGELHDIGKFAIPDAILNKPGPLDDDEWAYIKRHSAIGERIIAAAPALAGVAKLVRSIHERIDGTGYPDGLTGEEIPLGARIVSVCDAYDAMTNGDRPYRKAINQTAALVELRRCAGTQFDAAVVDAFCAASAATEAAAPANGIVHVAA
jgi:two-component system cell cycle response regulator